MILCCGEALIDMLPGRDSKGKRAFLPVPGGSPYNTAIAIARLETEVTFLGKISSDFFGEILVNNLKRNNVDTNFIVRSENNTTLAFVNKREDGSAEYAFYNENSADRNLRENEIPLKFSSNVKCIEYGSISLLMEPGSKTIENLIVREYNSRVISFDPNIRAGLIRDRDDYLSLFNRMIQHSHIVKISDEDVRWVYPDLNLEDAALRLLEAGPLVVIVTMGSEGAFALTRKGKVDVEALEVSVSDTVGAGDTFHAAFLAFLHEKNLMSKEILEEIGLDTLEESLRFSIRASSITCSRPGADPPFKSEMEN